MARRRRRPTEDRRRPAEDRGRSAEGPSEIPPAGWRDILLRVKDEASKDNLSIAAAGVAFYLLLAIFPALTALVSIYGLVADPADVQAQMASLGSLLPAQAYDLLNDQLTSVVQNADSHLSLGVVFGLLLTIWSVTKGLGALMTALNIAYGEKEKRGFIKLTAVTVALTVGAILGIIVALGMIVVVPIVLDFVGLGGGAETLISLLRWPLLALLVLFGLAVVYRYGPSRDKARWQWITWGAAAATALWIVGSLLFSWYVANFEDYNKTYGSIGAVISLLMWLYYSAYIVLMGAELNAEIEHQTARDSTVGPSRPIGARRARMADTVGRSP